MYLAGSCGFGEAAGADETLNFEKPSLEGAEAMGGGITLTGAADADGGVVIVSGSTGLLCSGVGASSGGSVFLISTACGAGAWPLGVPFTTRTEAVGGWTARGMDSSMPFAFALKCCRIIVTWSAVRLELWLFPVMPRFSRNSSMGLFDTPNSLASWFMRNMNLEPSVLEKSKKTVEYC
jgi:hypothetical protein